MEVSERKNQIEPNRSQEYQNEEEIDLMELLRVIWKNRKMIAIITGIIFAISVGVAMVQPKIYVADCTYTTEESKSSGGMLSSLASSIPFAAMAGLSSGSGGIDYKAIMESRTFREDIIKELNLFDFYLKYNKINLEKIPQEKRPDIVDATEWLEKIVVIDKDIKTKPSIHTIAVTLKDAKAASEIANAYPVVLERYLKEKNVTKSRRNREFVEKQLKIFEDEVKLQEEELKMIQQRYKTISIGDEAKAAVELFSGMKKDILELNAKIKMAKEFAGDENIEVKKLQKQKEVYEGQLESLKSGDKNSGADLIAMKDIPDIKIRVSKLERELTAKVEVYKVLLAQYETAKIDEVKDASIINILDKSIVPKKPEQSKKKVIVAVGLVLGMFLGVFIAFFREFIKTVDWKKITE